MKKIKAFTMIEILIISIVISTGLFAIFTAANHAKLVNQRVMQTVIANQLATEGTEIVYQTRNTNLLRYNKDKTQTNNLYRLINDCRLSIDYDDCKMSISTNSLNEIIIHEGNYYIETDENGKNTIKSCNETGCENQYDPRYAICLKDGVRNPCTSGHELGGDESRYGKFFRVIEGKGIYDMSKDQKGGKKIKIIEGNEYTADHIVCDTKPCQAQEFRFCSRVYRVGGLDGEIEICSTMTNFIEK